MKKDMRKYQRLEIFFYIVILATSVALLLGRGITGPGLTFQDSRTLYIAGKCWHANLNPYEPEVFQKCGEREFTSFPAPFAYPPQIAPLCLFLSLWSYPIAALFVIALNLIGLVALIWGSIRLIELHHANIWDAHIWWIVPFIIGNQFTSAAFWSGQTTILVTAGLVWAWVITRPAHETNPMGSKLLLGCLAGLCLAIASNKPQLSLLPILWIILERRWLPLFVMAIVNLAAASIPFRQIGFIQTWIDWLEVVAFYRGEAANLPTSPWSFGIQSTLVALGIPAPSLIPLGLLLFVGLWLLRNRLQQSDVLAILLSCSLLFLGTHDYDLTALVPLISCLYLHAYQNKTAAIISAILFCLLIFPSHLFKHILPLQAPIMFHYREVIVLLLTICLFICSLRQDSELQQQ